MVAKRSLGLAYRVLVVAGDRAAVEAVSRHHAATHRVEVATTLGEAMAAVRTTPLDAIVCHDGALHFAEVLFAVVASAYPDILRILVAGHDPEGCRRLRETGRIDAVLDRDPAEVIPWRALQQVLQRGPRA